MKSVKNRARQRGTAMMEALPVITVLTLLFAGTVYFQATYSAKIKSLQNTRVYAWTYALQGCNKVPENAKIGVLENPPAGAVDAPPDNTQSDLANTGNSVPGTGTELDNDSSYTDSVFGTGQGVKASRIGTVDATSTVRMVSFNVLRIQGGEMTSSSHVQCNPTPADKADIVGVAINAGRNLANF